VTGSPVLIEDIGAVRVVSLNRPACLNAIDAALAVALRDALRKAAAAPAIRAVVLTGEGRAFCAGADRNEGRTLTTDNADVVRARATAIRDVHWLLTSMDKPVVAAVSGAAIGGGAGLLVACDLAVVGDDLRFGYPELQLGLVPALVAAGLQRRIGPARAFDLLSLGAMLDAGQALALGLVNRVVETAAVRDAALDLAGRLSALSPQAMGATKALLRQMAETTFAGALDLGVEINVAMRGFSSATGRQ